jgi:aspartyl-tRNA(Asn)/glutamyl-tRNA(Gln) amidotransferase subunit A
LTTAARIIEAVRSGRRTAESAAASALDGIRRVEPKIQAFLSVDDERVLLDAREVDLRISRGEDLPLAGLPLAVKDNMTVRGYAATCASKILEGFLPGYDATAVARLKRAGAVVVGKTNLDEFAMGSSTENSAFAMTRNPWDLDRVPGGSSGGSAAAVASREVPAALGSDTGGSVRQPAALCGVVGLKPTYGRISRYGLVAFASSLDQIGPLTRNVEDSALLYAAMAGADPLDSTTAARDVGSPLAAVSRGLDRLRVGILREALVDGLDPEVRDNFQTSIEIFRRLGAEVQEVTIPRAPYAIPIYYVVANAEASSNLARFDGIRFGPRKPAGALEEFYSRQRGDGFGPEVKRRILLGTFALSAGYSDAYYRRASRARQLLRRDFEAAFSQVDVILCPTVPAPAFRVGEKVDDPISMYLSDVFTTPASLSGLPAISVPSGRTRAGLPLGLQIAAGWWQEETLFSAAGAFEKEARIGDVAPPVSA